MKVFIAQFKGVWLGGDAVIVAADLEQAMGLLKADLVARKLETDGISMEEISLESALCHVIDDGDY